jgi:hypothetical protein
MHQRLELDRHEPEIKNYKLSHRTRLLTIQRMDHMKMKDIFMSKYFCTLHSLSRFNLI